MISLIVAAIACVAVLIVGCFLYRLGRDLDDFVEYTDHEFEANTRGYCKMSTHLANLITTVSQLRDGSLLLVRVTVADEIRRRRKMEKEIMELHTAVSQLRELSADSPSEFNCGHCSKTMTQGEVRGMCCGEDSRPAHLICDACLRKYNEEQQAEADEAESWIVDP